MDTVHLGRFSRERANEIAEALEEAGIEWWFKEPGYFSQLWEYGVRLFVDSARLDDARSIVTEIDSRLGPG
jgi:signal recognition particle subunit SEC65